MDIARTEVIQIWTPPRRSVPWDGKLMAVRNGSVLYIPVAFWREGKEAPLHRRILAAAGLKRIRRNSPENLGGCMVKMFMGTMVLSGSSGDFGMVKRQEETLPIIKTALREFLSRQKIVVNEIDTDELDV
jgi:hypothetical protein